MNKLYCNYYSGDSANHLYVSCMINGVVTSLQCMECECRTISDARVDILNQRKQGFSQRLVKGDKE